MLGEQSVPTTNIDDRKRFIQRTLQELWIQYPWPFATATATLSLTNNVATLASGVGIPVVLWDVRDVQGGTGSDHVFVQSPYSERDDWDASSYHYWLEGEDTATPRIHTTATNSTLTVKYTVQPPVVNASVSAPFPRADVVALGALRYVRMGEDPTADISQEETQFQRKLEEIWGWYNRNKPRRARARTISEVSGHYPGRI